MGERIELTTIYRPQRKPTVVARLKRKVRKMEVAARTSRYTSPPLAVEDHRAVTPVSTEPGSINRVYPSDAHEELARRRAVKAAQMRRYRANLKERRERK